MYLSQFFAPLVKETPSDAQVVSHQLMLRAGMIRQLTSGIYTWLPLGLRVLRKVENIIREELNAIGAQEILMPAIQPASLWIESERYDAYGKEMLRIKDRHDNDMLFGPTHEEVVTDIFRNNVKSYKELPLSLYQIQTKFRDEIRPRFGLMRGREFMMKDAYSFDIDEESASKTYEKFFNAYYKIFKRIGVTAIPLKADTGAIGGNLSHEFHILAESGESGIFYDPKILELDEINLNNYQDFYAATDEKHDVTIAPANVVEKRGIEVGHVFYLGQKYSQILDAKVQSKSGEYIHPFMGCYGIGVSRVVAAVIEASNDASGIIWPKAIAPFDIMITPLKYDGEIKVIADKLYNLAKQKGFDALIDDRDQSAGKKMATADLIGIPLNIVIGNKSIESQTVELRTRSGEIKNIAFDNLESIFA